MSLLEYIKENKEWMFSGVGATILIFFFQLFKLNKSNILETKNKSRSNKISLKESNNNTIQIIEKQIHNNHGSTLNESANVDFANILPINIKSEIENAPLYQQQIVASHYVGLRISWDLELFTIFKRDEDLILVCLVPEKLLYPNIEFEADLKKYPAFRIAKKGQHYCLKGEIIECTSFNIKIKMESIKELN